MKSSLPNEGLESHTLTFAHTYAFLHAEKQFCRHSGLDLEPFKSSMNPDTINHKPEDSPLLLFEGLPSLFLISF